jgi:hypothetical protein
VWWAGGYKGKKRKKKRKEKRKIGGKRKVKGIRDISLSYTQEEKMFSQTFS